MDSNSFREFGKAAVDFIADYMDNIRDLDVLPSVSPGYLSELLPSELPETPEHWKTILEDVNKVIVPGLTHWQSPNFHAYYPAASSFPSMVGEMLSAGFSVVGFSWIASPACTELEVIVMDWLAKFLNLPACFLHSSDGPGGGIIQGSASESILVAVLAAREQAVKLLQMEHPEWSESEIRGKLVAYSSDQSNSCVEKAGRLAAVPVRLLPTGSDFIIRSSIIQEAIAEDKLNGKIPIICIATLGTTGTCAYDDIHSIAPICNEYNIWLHVDAAYAGAGLALEEYSFLLRGLESADSLNFNLHKFMLVNFDCTAMWFKDANNVVDSFNVDRIYLKHQYEGLSKIPDFRHWQIPLGRRFRALKVWITLRTMGAEGIRENIRQKFQLAERFEKHVLNDSRFEIVTERTMGLVCFRLKGSNVLTTMLLERLTSQKKIYMVQAKKNDKHFLRFAVCGMDPQEKDIDYAWDTILVQAEAILKEERDKPNETHSLYLHDIKCKNEFTPISQSATHSVYNCKENEKSK